MDYTKTTWVDDDGSGTTGTDFTAARMNNIEDGIADAIAHNRIGAVSAMPAAAAGNKNWLWIATDTDGTGGLYRSDGSAWVKMPVGALPNNVRFGVGGFLNSFQADYSLFGVNYNSITDRLVSTSRPGWILELDARSGFDVVKLSRAAATAGSPTWILLFQVDSSGMLSAPGWTRGQLVSSLPTTGPGGGALVDGQECYYLADAATGTVWHLKYRAAEAGSFKWYYVGGSGILKTVDAAESTSSLNYVDLTTVGPSITVPLAGDYDMEISAIAAGTGGANRCFVSPKKNALAVVDTDGSETSVAGGSTNTGNPYRRRRLTGVAANDVFKLQYGNLNATAVSYGYRTLKMTPVRVG